ncbi:MAG: bifunctional precorrin-2 dehydrogenase/sirohydrochlorin ferrochelatase [Nitrospirae bacterium]|nr:bifunctional precorrin-2 dehydrogenase/sirohydrochlorin ferrochelatase [Nitrospirota bacterium]
MKYYPVFLDLKDKKAVIIGGGKVAERKVRLLITTGASIKLISPDITTNLRKLAEKGLLKHIKRNYRDGDLNNAFIVIAATSSAALNMRIAREAGLLVNVIDAPSEGNYIVPSVIKRGPLTIAISTEGASPAVSKAIRKEIEGLYGKEFALYLKFAETIRKQAMKKIIDSRVREKFLQSLASEDIFKSLRERGFSGLSQKISASLKKKS